MTGFWRKFLGLDPSPEEAPPAPFLQDDRPADGLIEVAVVPGFVGVRLAEGSEFERFASCQPHEAESGSSSSTRQPVPRMRGRVVLASIFVGRDGQGWSDAELVKAHRALKRAATWIEREAARYGATLNLTLPAVCFAAQDLAVEEVAIEFLPEGDTVGPHELDADWRATASASRAAAVLGFADLADLDHQLVDRLPCDGHAWLVHLRRAGRSFAIGVDRATLPGVPIAVCYAREASFSEPLRSPPFVDPVTLIHELLHLFGATDKYGIAFDRFPPGEVTSRDVMLLATNALSRLRVDPLTAREIGWLSWRDVSPLHHG
jgi:hypothetical protein